MSEVKLILDTLLFIIVIILINDKIAEKFKTFKVPQIVYKVLIYVYLIIIFAVVIFLLLTDKSDFLLISSHISMASIIVILSIIDFIDKKD